MKYDFLAVDKKGRIATVRFDRPGAHNTLNAGLMKELTHIAGKFRDDPATGVIILYGGEKFFSAGLDLNDTEILSIFEERATIRRMLLEAGPRMCKAWEELPQITIAAIEGFCIGGAVSLSLACDFRIMAQNAHIRISEIDLGMNYSWGSIARLVSLVGPARSKKWVITADKVECPEAMESGFAQWSCPPGFARQKALGLAEKIKNKPQMPVSMTKQTINAMSGYASAIGHMDMDQFALTALSEDSREGIRAFLEKRRPLFNKDLPDD